MKALRGRLAEKPYYGAPALVLGVSGGKDSMVLLDVFQRMQHVHQSPLKVVHVDHHTGEHAAMARDLVTKVCKVGEISLFTFDFEWDGQGNFEHAASQFRRNALKETRGDGYAVLAHHQQDQAETLMMALARGAGITSPLGMVPEKDHRLRPFLDISQNLIHEHARIAGLEWCEDPTNADTQRFRNAVRHLVIPQLEAVHEDLGSRMGGWLEEYHTLQAHLFAEAERIMLSQDAGASKLDPKWCSRKVFTQNPSYLWPFLLARYWERLSLTKPKRTEHLQLMVWLKNGEIGCFDHAGKRLYCDSDGLAWIPRPEMKPVPAKFGQSVDFGLWSLKLDWLKGKFPWPIEKENYDFHWVAGLTMSKRFRERLRLAGIPLRVRQHLPGLIANGVQIHLGELLALQEKGTLELVRESGPDWSC